MAPTRRASANTIDPIVKRKLTDVMEYMNAVWTRPLGDALLVCSDSFYDKQPHQHGVMSPA